MYKKLEKENKKKEKAKIKKGKSKNKRKNRNIKKEIKKQKEKNKKPKKKKEKEQKKMGSDSSLAYSAIEGTEIDDTAQAPRTLPPGIAPELGLVLDPNAPLGRSVRDRSYLYHLTTAPYTLPVWSEESKVSCSKCDWHLEDPEWCCDLDCNQPGPHYRTAYVCKDPSDPENKITAHCDEHRSCRGDAPPKLCTPTRLEERQKEDTRNDPVCVKRNGNKKVS